MHLNHIAIRRLSLHGYIHAHVTCMCVSMCVCVCVCIYMYTFATRLRNTDSFLFGNIIFHHHFSSKKKKKGANKFSNNTSFDPSHVSTLFQPSSFHPSKFSSRPVSSHLTRTSLNASSTHLARAFAALLEHSRGGSRRDDWMRRRRQTRANQPEGKKSDRLFRTG